MKRLICWLGGNLESLGFPVWPSFHRLYVVRGLGFASELVGCHRCSRRWAMHHGVQCILPWDADLQELYEEVRQ